MGDVRTIRSLTIQNLLSFGPEPTTIELKNLNVLIGANGSGKSNLIEVLGLLQSLPNDFAKAILNGGGIDQWLWKGAWRPEAVIEAVGHFSRSPGRIPPPPGYQPLKYHLRFTQDGYFLRIADEIVEGDPLAQPYFRRSEIEPIDPQASILSEVKGPYYGGVSQIGREFENFRLYRRWEFGGLSRVRQRCDPRLQGKYLEEDASNLGAVLRRLLADEPVKAEIIASLKSFYEGAIDLTASFHLNEIQTSLEEKHLRDSIPLIRLSDGTIRWLCLLCILLNPEPPPLVCIEEPELGLHPDMIHELGKLLIEASTRMQLVITTHSSELIEDFSEQPDSVLVCEKENGVTKIERLDAERLSEWLKEYSLGELWRKGKFGGNRW